MRQPAIALIDGEHYPPVVAEALAALSAEYEVRAAVFLGGTEKIKSDDLGAEAELIYGVPVVFAADPQAALAHAIAEYDPRVVVDLSDEPVVGYIERFRYASHTLARNVSYIGSDFRLDPPKFECIVHAPSLSIIGTAKRVGKTALSGFVARTIQGRLRPGSGSPGVVVVAMGRGGPERPEVIDGSKIRLGAKELLEWSRQGRHAASDHFEDAALSRVITVGCRRCGGGLAGMPFVSNVPAGARMADELHPEFVIFEGSGAALPPIATDARMCVAGAHQPLDYLGGYLGTYRVLISDAVVLTMAEEPLAGGAKVRAAMSELSRVKPGLPVVPVVFRPRPLGDVRGRRVAFFCTAPTSLEETLRRHLEETYGCIVGLFSPHLSNRRLLREDFAGAEMSGVEVVLTEIKAAAIDVVVEEAEARGVPVVFVDNDPVEVAPAEPGDVVALCDRLVEMAQARFLENGGPA